MKSSNTSLLALALMASFGAAANSAKPDFSNAVLGQNANFFDNTQIRLAAPASGYANFTVPTTFPTDAEDGDSIRVSVDLEISNPGEGFDPRSGNAPEDLKSSELCNLTVILSDKPLWVGELLPTFKVLEIVSNHTFTYTDEIKQASLSVRQDCPNLASEFLIHEISLFIEQPFTIYAAQSGSSTATDSAAASTGTSDSSSSEETPATVDSSASTSATFGLYWLAAAGAFFSLF